ncbi:MAG: DUF4340 domain-containing protein [Verrucomicrobia bacterium]|nr:DUF4340 domain-containing protein [Verrucomicrobiota bacterium]
MRGKTTIFLGLLALALLTYIVLVDPRKSATDERAAAQAVLFPNFDRHRARAVTLVSSNQTLRAERDGFAWKLTAPVAYPGNAPALEVLLEGVAKLSPGRRISPAEVSRQPQGLASYGLQPPQLTVTIEQATNKIELRLGTLTPVGEQLYFQVAGEAGVFTAGTNFYQRLPRTVDDWRDPQLLHFTEAAFNRVEIRAANRGFEVQRDTNAGAWKLTRPMAARADNPKLDHFLQLARNWRVAGFVTDDPKADLDAFGLAPPELELVFGQGTNEIQTIQFGKVLTNLTNFVYARRLSHTNVVLLPKAALATLQHPFSDYRDRRLATVDPAQADVLEVRAEDFFTLRRETNGAWRVTEPLNFAADPEIVNDLVASLGSLEVLDFVKDVVTDFSAYGLAKPARQYALKTATTNAGGAPTNTLIAQIELGAMQADRIFARRSDEDSVYAVPLGSVLRLPQSLFQVRDRHVWSFTTNDVVAVTVRQSGRTLQLARNAKGEWTDNGGGAPNLLALEETMHRLGAMQAAAWVARGADKKARFGFAKAAHQIEIEIGGARPQKLAFELGSFSSQHRRYAATQIEGEAVIFEMPPSVEEAVGAFLTLPPVN